MTQEEKAKAYDEAIERAKYYYCTTDSAADIKLIGLMFPELKESEDERISKEIISYIKNSTVCIDTDTFKKWIAWLEKHGKNNMGISEATKRKLEFNLNTALEKETPESWNEFLDGEQESAWSEEDEKFFKTALWHISYSISKGKSTDFQCDTTEWFKSLKDRIQPKQ